MPFLVKKSAGGRAAPRYRIGPSFLIKRAPHGHTSVRCAHGTVAAANGGPGG